MVAAHRTAPRPTPVLESSVRPSAEDLEALRELGAMGYIRGILEKLDAIDRLTPASAHFTAPLRTLVKSYRLDEFNRQLKEAEHERADQSI